MENTRVIGTLDRGLLMEAIVVGLLIVIVGVLVHMLIKKVKPDMLPRECAEWNKHHIMELCLFMTGAFVHVISEFSGINQKYVDKYCVPMLPVV